MVRSTVARFYNIERVHLPEAAEGRVLALRLSSLKHPNDDRAHFNLVNVYLSSGRAAMTEKLRQINTLSHVDASTHTIMGGDFNFIENAADTTVTGHMAGSSLSGDAKAAWVRECDRLRLSLGCCAGLAHSLPVRGWRRVLGQAGQVLRLFLQR